MRNLFLGVLLAIGLLTTSAHGRWKPEYADRSPEERAWYERQQTTPEFRARVQADWYKFCCDHSDTVDAQFQKQQGVWQYRLEGTTEWKDIPQDIVQPDVMTPGGRGVLFIDPTGHGFGPTCFFPGGTGT